MHTFETERLVMKQLSAHDKELYLTCYTDPTLMRHVGAPLSPNAALLSFNATLKMASANPVRRHTWAMQEKAFGGAIGLLALDWDQTKPEPISAEIGIILLSKFQNRRYPIEAVGGLVDFVFGHGRIDVLLGKHKIHNGAASKIMRCLGFALGEGNPDEAIYSQWTLSRSDWLARSTPTDPP